jgi:hypothetical protein
MTRFNFTVFYMKTWICPPQTFFDPSQNLCSGCPIINCIDCLNLTYCTNCDQSIGYFLDTATGQCITCNIIGCTNCVTSGICLQCNSSLNYILDTGNNSCTDCSTITANTFADPNTNSCLPCPLSNCITCLTIDKCDICSANYAVDSNYICQYCDNTLNYFINLTVNNIT